MQSIANPGDFSSLFRRGKIFYMDMAGHGGGHMEGRREAPRASARELKSVSEVRDAISQLGSNLLNERNFIEKLSGDRGAWLEGLQSKIDAREAFPLEVSEGGAVVGFVLADAEGAIVQLRCPEGKEETVIERALYALRDKGYKHPTIRLRERSEHLRHMLHRMGFERHEGEHEDDGKVGMIKE